MTLLFALALAETYDLDLYVPDAPPVHFDRYNASVIFPDLGAGYPDGEVVSTWSNLTCLNREGTLSVVVDMADPWPSIPATATCVYGNDSLVVTLLQVDMSDGDVLPEYDAASVLSLDLASDVSGHWSFGFPSSVPHAPGVRTARDDQGFPIPGLKCKVDVTTGSTPVLQLIVASNDVEGSATCSLGQATIIDIEIDRS